MFCNSLQLNFALLLSAQFHHFVSGYASLPMNMWGNAKSLCGKTVSSGNFKLQVPKLWYGVSENPTIAFFTIGSYIHSYKFKICTQNSLQNNGMILLVVKTLAARIWGAFNSNVLSTCTRNAVWEILANIEIFVTSLNMSSVREGIRNSSNWYWLLSMSFLLQGIILQQKQTVGSQWCQCATDHSLPCKTQKQQSHKKAHTHVHASHCHTGHNHGASC